MPKTRAQKAEMVGDLSNKLSGARSVVISQILGLTVSEMTELKSLLRKEGVSNQVVKISLLKLALARAGMAADSFDIHSQISVSYADDETSAARILKDFAKEHENLKLVSGFLEKQSLSLPQVMELANLPSKQQLLGQLANVLAGPSKGLVTVLSGNLRGLVQVLSQVQR